MKKKYETLLCYVIPTIFMIVQMVVELSFSADLLSRLHSENGPHELIQFCVISFAVLAGIGVLIKILPRLRENRLLFAWVLLATVCSFYVAGEEISWGQQVAGWATPEGWSHINDQQETNLHNTSSWLDQKPRLLLELSVIAGGIVIPFMRRFVPRSLPRTFEVLYPQNHLFLVGVLAILPKGLDRLLNLFDVMLLVRASELQETFFYYFVLLYILDLSRKVRTGSPA